MLKQKQSGFTIVELLIVIVVIGILAALVLNSFSGAQSKARDSRRATDVQAIKKALEAYKAESSIYPAACVSDDWACSVSFLSPYLTSYGIQTVPNDPSSGKIYEYVRGPVASDQYGLLVGYETKPVCKTGFNVNQNWWGFGTPQC